MIDRKQVIHDIERCTCRVRDACRDCSKHKEDQPAVICMEELLTDVLKVLKEQEPKLVEIDGQLGGIKYGRCPKCEKGINEEVYPHWCGFCGQEVKWE